MMTSDHCQCSIMITSSPREEPQPANVDGRNARRPDATRSSVLLRAVTRISRARWFSFLRRVFRYQNGPRSDLLSSPFNTRPWLALELAVLVAQTVAITATLVVSRNEEAPFWPLRVWISGYSVGNLLSLPLLYWRYRHLDARRGFSDEEQQQQRRESSEETSSCVVMMSKARRVLDLFFAIWFVMGNVWVFDSRLMRSFEGAPRLHALCVALLAWNALVYSLPFLLFVLLCCCVPCVGTVLGYNMNTASVDRGASEHQIASLPHWKFFKQDERPKPEGCCICLAKYKEHEEVRQLPCLHVFHLGCVDQWLRIISSCPLCKHQVQRG